MICTIYALAEPGSAEVRYDGQTTGEPEKRLEHHICEAKRNQWRSHRLNWIRSILAKNQSPELRVLATCVEPQATWWERIFISAYRALGFRLVNGTDGGEGAPGAKRSAETRALIAAAQLGRKHSPETRAKRSAALRGRKISAEAIEKRTAARKGFHHTPEARAKIGTAQRGKKRGPRPAEIIKDMSERMKRRMSDPVMLAAHRARMADPAVRARMSVSRMGHITSSETRARIGEGNRRRAADAKTKERMRAAAKKRMENPVLRTALREAQERWAKTPEGIKHRVVFGQRGVAARRKKAVA
jgi:hypothetical protein